MRGPESSAYTIAFRGREDDELLKNLRLLLEDYKDIVVQVSLRREMPHLILRVSLPPLMEDADKSFLADLSGWLSGGKSGP